IIGIGVTLLFGLTASGLTSGAQESARLATLQHHHLQTLSQLTVPQMILSFIPTNPFLELTGAKSTSIISVVIFAVLLGIASLKLVQDDKQEGQAIINGIDVIQSWIMKLVRIVIQLTPYGVFALMAKMAA